MSKRFATKIPLFIPAPSLFRAKNGRGPAAVRQVRNGKRERAAGGG